MRPPLTSFHNRYNPCSRKTYKEKHLDFEQVLHFCSSSNRCIRHVNIRYARAISMLFLPLAMALTQFAVVVVAAFTLLFYTEIGLLNSYIALSVILGNIFMIGMITKMSSKLIGKSNSSRSCGACKVCIVESSLPPLEKYGYILGSITMRILGRT